MTSFLHKLFTCMLCAASVCLAAEKQATVRLCALNEVGDPVPNLNVIVIFKGIPWQKSVEVEVKTDAKGMAEAHGWPGSEFMSSVSIVANNIGYYSSHVGVGAKPEDREFDIKLLVRKIENPIPMFANTVELELPVQRKEIGFDFIKADWVRPYGKGHIADCTFIGTKTYEDGDNYQTSVVMGFPGEKSGLLLDAVAKKQDFERSDFKTSRSAPTDGYEAAKEFTAIKTSEKGYEGSTTDATYLFRSRVQLDEEGKIVSCHYGKMIDAVNVATKSGRPEGNPIVRFTYYFNPTPMDRNLEFDPKQNLFPSSDGNLQVVKP